MSPSPISYSQFIREQLRMSSGDKLRMIVANEISTDYEAAQFGLLDFALSAGSDAGGIDYETAAIATVLYPLVREHIQPTTELYVVGQHGNNITASDYPWKDHLKEWIQKGIVIHYLLIDPPMEAQRTLLALQTECHNASRGKLKVWIADTSDLHGNSPSERESRAWLKRLKTTHFAAFQTPDMLWLEADHSQETTTAKGCVFYGAGNSFGKTVATSLVDRFKKICSSGSVKPFH